MTLKADMHKYRLPTPDDQLQKLAMAQPMVSRCANCTDTFEGSADAAIQWGIVHRQVCK